MNRAQVNPTKSFATRIKNSSLNNLLKPFWQLSEYLKFKVKFLTNNNIKLKLILIDEFT